MVMNLPAYITDAYIYRKYKTLSRNCDIILSHVAALEALGYFSGYYHEYPVEYYAETPVDVPNTVCHIIKDIKSIECTFAAGVMCTDIARTIADVLDASDRIDDTPILEALNVYYFEHNQSFDGLRLSEKGREKLREYEQDAIDYC